MARILIVFPKSPAGLAGLSTNQMIRGINGISVKGKSGPECVALMSGPVGTKVQLELHDPNNDATKFVELTKAKFVTVVGRKKDKRKTVK